MSVRVGLGRQTEKQFQGAVVELCRLRGYLTYHATRSGAGANGCCST
jgi:hypothetical protein